MGGGGGPATHGLMGKEKFCRHKHSKNLGDWELGAASIIKPIHKKRKKTKVNSMGGGVVSSISD